MSKGILRQASIAGAMAAGVVLLVGGAAHAGGPDMTSAGNHGIGDGNQLLVPVQVPVDLCGNGVGALVGIAGAGCQGGADADLESGTLGDMVSAGNNGILDGNQAEVPVQVPVDICGNAVGALVGLAGAGCQGGADANIGDEESGHVTESVHSSGGHHGDDGTLGDMVSAGNNGILDGNQLEAPIQVPIDICGNSIAVLGVAGAGCQGGADANIGDEESGHVTESVHSSGGHHGDDGTLGDMVSAGNNGILDGNQLEAPIQIPIDICGNSIAVLGVAGAGCQGGADANIGDEESGRLEGGTLGDMVSAGNHGILDGNQLQLPIEIPIDVSGNAIAVLGVAGAGSQGGADANIG